ncbi:MAG: hypothetical protein IKZ43_08350 [Acidaminococcaceae bacterium]|nr:hypothetical protein [Acidaminococcaceae bacterium]
MNFQTKAKLAWQHLALAFYPMTTLYACIVGMVLVNVILIAFMCFADKGSFFYNILFALFTGAAASFFVTVIVEMTNNYKRNMLAWHELQEYYTVVIDYEAMKHILMGNSLSQRIKKEVQAEMNCLDDEEIMEECDLVQATWKQLPEIMPVLRETFSEKKAFLTDEEIFNLRTIISYYDEIRDEIKTRIEWPLLHNSVNHPDTKYLKIMYPKNIVQDFPKWMRKIIAENESLAAIDRITDAVMKDEILLTQYMDNYDISQQAIDNYNPADDNEGDNKSEEDLETDNEYIGDDFEEEDEETFKKKREDVDRQLEKSMVPFVSWHISTCCLEIAQSIEELEVNIKKKPYVGMRLEWNKNISHKKLEGPIADILYKNAREKFEKRKGNA